MIEVLIENTHPHVGPAILSDFIVREGSAGYCAEEVEFALTHSDHQAVLSMRPSRGVSVFIDYFEPPEIRDLFSEQLEYDQRITRHLTFTDTELCAELRVRTTRGSMAGEKYYRLQINSIAQEV